MFRRISQSSVERAFKGPLCYTEVAAEHVDPTLPLAAAHCANKRFNGIPAMPPKLPTPESTRHDRGLTWRHPAAPERPRRRVPREDAFGLADRGGLVDVERPNQLNVLPQRGVDRGLLIPDSSRSTHALSL